MPYRWNNRPPLLLVLIGALLVLALLQYRWVLQVNEAESERIARNLLASAARFGEAFDRELTNAYISFQFDVEDPQQGWREFDERYRQWSALTAYDELVAQVYWADTDADGRLRLARFDRAAQQMVLTDWPAEFALVRAQLERESQDTQIALDRFAATSNQFSGSEPVVVLQQDPIAEAIPALIVPSPFGPFVPNSQGQHRFFGYVIVQLDRAVIRERLVPDLAARFFSSGNGLDYNLALVSQADRNQVIYQSNPALSVADLGPGDATVAVLGLRFNTFDAADPIAVEFGAVARPLPASPGLPQPTASPPETVALPATRSTEVAINAIDEVPASRLYTIPADLSAVGGRWQLIVTHRDGSLQSAVRNMQTRNLATSFGILVLLASGLVIMLVVTQRAQRLADQQMQFVASVSHELRTPLAVIRSAGENLADGLIDDSRRAQQYGALISHEGRRLTEMVEQVLAVAGAQSGRRAYTRQPIDTRDLLEQVLVEFRGLPEAHGYEFVVELADVLPPLLGDAAALRQALQNLLANALKYSGGQTWIGVSAFARGGEVVVSVRDRGIGIERGELRQIFEPFFRGRAAVDGQIHGSGLGLSLVKQIVEAHGGSVAVESQPGHGSVFILRLPQAPADARTTDPRATPLPPAG